MTTQDHIDSYLQDIAAKGRSPRTIRAYRSDLRPFVEWLGPDIGRIAHVDIGSFLKAVHSGQTLATRARREAAVSSFLGWSKRHRIIDANPMEDEDRTRTPIGDPRPIPHRQLSMIMRAVDSEFNLRDRTIIWLLHDTGARVSEVLRIRPEDVDLDRGFLSLTVKGGRSHTVPLVSEFRSIVLLSEMLMVSQDGSYIFHSRSSKRHLSYSYIETSWIKLVRNRLQMSYTIHQLRHSRATELLDRGVSLASITSLLGHRDPRTTMRYAKMSPSKVKEDISDALRN